MSNLLDNVKVTLLLLVLYLFIYLFVCLFFLFGGCGGGEGGCKFYSAIQLSILQRKKLDEGERVYLKFNNCLVVLSIFNHFYLKKKH